MWKWWGGGHRRWITWGQSIVTSRVDDDSCAPARYDTADACKQADRACAAVTESRAQQNVNFLVISCRELRGGGTNRLMRRAWRPERRLLRRCSNARGRSDGRSSRDDWEVRGLYWRLLGLQTRVFNFSLDCFCIFSNFLQVWPLLVYEDDQPPGEEGKVTNTNTNREVQAGQFQIYFVAKTVRWIATAL